MLFDRGQPINYHRRQPLNSFSRSHSLLCCCDHACSSSSTKRAHTTYEKHVKQKNAAVFHVFLCQPGEIQGPFRDFQTLHQELTASSARNIRAI